MERTDCTHFEYNYINKEGKKSKNPSCKIGKMKGATGCNDYCEWFEPLGPWTPSPPLPPGSPEPLKPP